MDWKDVAGKLTGSGIKLLGNVLGETPIGKVTKLVSSVLGVGDSPNEVYEELEKNPDAVLKLKQLEADHELELRKIYLEEFKIEVDDKKSARDREIQLTKTTGKKDWPTLVLGSVITVGFFGCISALMWVDMPQNNKEQIIYLLGALSASFTSLVNYYFGSSAGSAKKTEILANGHNNAG